MDDIYIRGYIKLSQLETALKRGISANIDQLWKDVGVDCINLYQFVQNYCSDRFILIASPAQIIENSSKKFENEVRVGHNIEEFEHVTYFADIYIVSLNYRNEISQLSLQHNGEEYMKSTRVTTLSELCFKLIKIEEKIAQAMVINEMKFKHIYTQIELLYWWKNDDNVNLNHLKRVLNDLHRHYGDELTGKKYLKLNWNDFENWCNLDRNERYDITLVDYLTKDFFNCFEFSKKFRQMAQDPLNQVHNALFEFQHGLTPTGNFKRDRDRRNRRWNWNRNNNNCGDGNDWPAFTTRALVEWDNGSRNWEAKFEISLFIDHGLIMPHQPFLHKMMKHSKPEDLSWLLDNHPRLSFNTILTRGVNALHVASYQGRIDNLKVVVDKLGFDNKNADPGIVNEKYSENCREIFLAGCKTRMKQKSTLYRELGYQNELQLKQAGERLFDQWFDVRNRSRARKQRIARQGGNDSGSGSGNGAGGGNDINIDAQPQASAGKVANVVNVVNVANVARMGFGGKYIAVNDEFDAEGKGERGGEGGGEEGEREGSDGADDADDEGKQFKDEFERREDKHNYHRKAEHHHGLNDNYNCSSCEDDNFGDGRNDNNYDSFADVDKQNKQDKQDKAKKVENFENKQKNDNVSDNKQQHQYHQSKRNMNDACDDYKRGQHGDWNLRSGSRLSFGKHDRYRYRKSRSQQDNYNYNCNSNNYSQQQDRNRYDYDDDHDWDSYGNYNYNNNGKKCRNWRNSNSGSGGIGKYKDKKSNAHGRWN